MRTKLLVSAICAIVGTTLLIASATAAPTAASQSKLSKGGTLKIQVPEAVFEDWDPQLAYDTLSWSMMYTMNMLLLNYPEKDGDAGQKLYPEAAAGFPKVSKDGKTYIYTVKKGIKFSDGTPLTAANFRRSFERILSPKMGGGSPQGPVLGLDQMIVGGQAFLEGKAQSISGVTAKGQVLTVRLNRPEPSFQAILAMQWFAPVKVDMPYSEEGVETYPSTGPYYLAENKKDQSKLLKRNPNYKGNRPAYPDQIVFTENIDENAALLQVKKGDADDTSPPAPEVASIAKEFGINKGRFFVKPQQCNSYFALNNTGGRSTDALNVRKAINWAVDRPAMVRAAGFLSGKRYTQILVPGVPGYKPFRAYAYNGANIPQAKKALGSSSAPTIVYVHRTTAGALARAQIMQYNLQQAGFKVDLQAIASRSQYFDTIGVKGAKYDIVSAGWCADYNDAYDWFNVLLDGRTIQEKNNVNYAYINNPQLNKLLDEAASKQGDARLAAYAALDKVVMTKFVPWAPLFASNSQFFVSPRAKNVIYSSYYTEAFYNAIALQ